MIVSVLLVDVVLPVVVDVPHLPAVAVAPLARMSAETETEAMSDAIGTVLVVRRIGKRTLSL